MKSTIDLDLRGVSAVEYYDQGRANKVLPLPLGAIYCGSVILILYGIKRQWIIDIAKMIRKKKAKK